MAYKTNEIVPSALDSQGGMGREPQMWGVLLSGAGDTTFTTILK